MITLNDKVYRSLSEAARKYDLNLSTLSRRVKRYGQNSPKLFSSSQKNHTIVLGGKKYDSISQACQKFNVSAGKIKRFLKTYGEKMPFNPEIIGGKSFYLAGKQYYSIKDFAQRNNLAYTTVLGRIQKYGLHSVKLLEPQNTIHNPHEIVLFKQKYTSIANAEKQLDLPRRYLQNRVYRYGRDTSKWPSKVLSDLEKKCQNRQ